MMSIASRITLAALMTILVGPVQAADLTVQQVRSALATAGHKADFSARSLEGLDLSHLDLSGVNFAGADLRRVKLVGSNLTGANLSGARMNLAWIMGADFTRANLSNAVLETLVVSAGLETKPDEAARFVEANLSGAHIMARFALDDMHGANFSHAMMAADMRNQSMGLIRTDFSGANLVGANFTGAHCAYASFRFARLAGANFSGASLLHTDFSGADLKGANLTGADATGADFGGADLNGATGLNSVKGLPAAAAR